MQEEQGRFGRLGGWLLKNDRWLLPAFLVFFFLIAFSIAAVQPHMDTPPAYGNPPDEGTRFLVPKYIMEHGRIPEGSEPEIRIPGYGFSYALYNAGPYLLMGWILRFASLFTDSAFLLLLIARTVNVLSGTLMAFFVKKLGDLWFPDRRFSWLFTLFVMLLPESLFMHTYVNTDSICMTSAAVILYGLSHMYFHKVGWKDALLVGIGSGVLMLSYYNAYFYLVVAVLLFVPLFVKKEQGKRRTEWKRMLLYGGMILGIALLVSGWWFVRSAILHQGDFLGLATRKRMEAEYGAENVAALSWIGRGNPVRDFIKNLRIYEVLGQSFTAVFGSMTIYGPGFLYVVYDVLFLLGIASFVILWPACRREGFQTHYFRINLFLCILAPFALWAYYSLFVDFQNQGRYLLPALIPLMYFIVSGYQRIRQTFKKCPESVFDGITAGFAFLWIGLLLYYVYGVAYPVYMDTVQALWTM